jgi:hypothetical protein
MIAPPPWHARSCRGQHVGSGVMKSPSGRLLSRTSASDRRSPPACRSLNGPVGGWASGYVDRQHHAEQRKRPVRTLAESLIGAAAQSPRQATPCQNGRSVSGVTRTADISGPVCHSWHLRSRPLLPRELFRSALHAQLAMAMMSLVKPIDSQ